MLADLDLSERLAAPVTLAAIRDLIEWDQDAPEPRLPFSPPLCLGWDIYRVSEGNAEGFALWRDLMHYYEPPLLAADMVPGDQRTATTPEQFDSYLTETWQSYHREKHWVDGLVVDAMHDARAAGWEICGEREDIRSTDATLDDLALRSGARRAATEARRMNDEAEQDEADFEAFTNACDSLFLSARKRARANPQWIQHDKPLHPSTVPAIETIIASDDIPEPWRADAFVEWVQAHVDRDEWDHDMKQFEIDVRLRATAFETQVRRNLFSFSGWAVNLKTNVPDATNPDNVRIFFRMHNIKMRFNEWHRRQEIQEGRMQSTEQPWVPLTDAILNRLMTEAGDSQNQFRPADALFRRTVATIANESPYDPLLERLATLEAEWDGVPRLSGWLARTTGVVDDAYHAAVGWNVVGGLVKRAREPGCKHDEVMLLSSVEQGLGKSSMCRILALQDEWFTDSVVFDGSPQNVIPQLHGKWCIELSELGNMGRKDAEHVKRFLSTQSDNFTAKYQALATDNARRCVFIGTTNSTNPLSDETGGRRWLPVLVPGEIDLEYLRKNIAQIVGEAATIHTRGESFAIPREVWDAAKKRQEAARDVSAVEELILKWFDRPTVGGAGLWVASTDIGHALKLSGQSGNAKYGVHLKKLGYRDENVVVPELGKRTRLWIRSPGGLDGCVRLLPVQRQPNAPVDMQMQSAPFGARSMPPCPV